MPHPANFEAGLWLILAGFISGALLGLGFHREEFMGGYGSFRRRLVRLGHIAFVALGFLNLIHGVAPIDPAAGPAGGWSGRLLIAGGIAMPVTCFLAAWKPFFRHLFFIPVSLLLGWVGVLLVLLRR
jgi:hypothetical protein